MNHQYFETTDQEQVLLRQFDESSEEEDQKPKGLFQRLSNKISQFTGNKVIEDEDLDEILVQIKEQLMAKNVAEEIAASLVAALRSQLLQTKTKAFTSVQHTGTALK